MFERILIPVDLHHAGRLDRALAACAAMARLHGAPVTLLGVTTREPSDVARSPQDYASKLDAFAADFAAREGVAAAGRTVVDPDPSADLDAVLAREVKETGADLVVMASHPAPGGLGGLFSGRPHGATLAGRTDASILLVRDTS
jgi:nucleotide-binding universal stress UspA family protein